MKKKKTLISAKTLVERILKKVGFEEDRFAVFSVWEKEMGKESSRVRLVGVKKNSLVVEVDSSVRLHDLTLRKRDILRRVNGHFPVPVISDIQLELSGKKN